MHVKHTSHNKTLKVCGNTVLAEQCYVLVLKMKLFFLDTFSPLFFFVLGMPPSSSTSMRVSYICILPCIENGGEEIQLLTIIQVFHSSVSLDVTKTFHLPVSDATAN